MKTGYGCSGASSRVSAVCFFSCIQGYEVARGSLHRTCQENGEWSGAQIQCRGNDKSLLGIYLIGQTRSLVKFVFPFMF